MKKLLIICLYLNLIYGYDIDALVNKDATNMTIDMSQEGNSINSEIRENSEKISREQLKLVAKLFAFNVEYSLSRAEGWCYQIKNEDAKNDCISGIYLAKDNISSAEGWCYQIKDEDAKNGCIAGIYLAKGNISSAEGWCYQIKNDDGKNGCMSGVNITGFFLKKEKEENEYQTRRINNLNNNINQIKNELSKDQQEALEMIKELEANPELLKDPETQILYQKLKGSLE